MTIERKLIAAAVSSALALPMAAQAVEFSVSGHVNRAVISVDTGGDDDDDLQHVDSNASETRFRFKGSEELDNGMNAGVLLELGRPSDWRTRHAALYLDTPGGKLTLGQTSAATDGMAHARLGGPSWLGGVTNWCSYYSKNAAGDTAVACPSNDGGRPDVLRYDTPSLGPATLSVSAGNNDYWDVMLKVAGSFGDAGYDIRVGHIAEYKGTDTETTPAALVPGSTQGSFTRVSAGQALYEEIHEPAEFTIGDAEDLAPAMAAWRERPENRGATIRLYSTGADAAANLVLANTLSEDGTVITGDTAFGGGNNAYRIEQPGYSTPATFTPASTTTIPTKPGDITTASAAVAFGQGTAVAVAWSQDANPAPNTDHEYTYVEVDHSYGDGSVGVYWKQGERGNGAGQQSTEGSLWGVGIGHNIGAGATAYAGYRVIKEDGISDNVSIILAGMRVTFN